MARQLGQPLMPWQELVADVGLELMADGRPAYREVIVTVPRQSGKTTLVLSWEVQRALGWNGPQRIAYTAQTGWDARKKLIDDQAPLLMASPLAGAVRQVLRGAGNEGIWFQNGSRIEVMASTETAGHGKTLDMAVIDEAFNDVDHRREQAIFPAMATRPAAQVVVVSTAGTAASLYLRQKVDAGRKAVLEGHDTGIAYFEWSAPDDVDPYDEAVWWRCMPALGHTITPEVVRHAAQSMAEGEFRRAFLNQWTAGEERVIPVAAWDAVNEADAAPGERVTLALDVNPERSAAALAASDGRVVELVDHRPGVSWVVDRVAEVAERARAQVVIDTAGPAGTFAAELERRRVRLKPITGRDLAMACMSFYDAVADVKVTVRRHPSLDAAVAAATKQSAGDSWRWARSSLSADISPLMAASLALAGSGSGGQRLAFFVT